MLIVQNAEHRHVLKDVEDDVGPQVAVDVGGVALNYHAVRQSEVPKDEVVAVERITVASESVVLFNQACNRRVVYTKIYSRQKMKTASSV